MTPRTWTCQRVTGGKKCGAVNWARVTYCHACRKAKPPKRAPAHRAALDEPYEVFLAITGGDHCGICGRERDGRHLDRDHAWVGPIKGKPRGLLCHSCNRTLSRRMEIAAAAVGLARWLRAAADYVERAETYWKEPTA